MTRADFAALNVTIHGGDEDHCACCGRELVRDGLSQRDHDHRTGWARGLVCWHCNNERLRNHTRETLLECLAYLERVAAFYA
jgi:hypothetical protein